MSDPALTSTYGDALMYTTSADVIGNFYAEGAVAKWIPSGPAAAITVPAVDTGSGLHYVDAVATAKK